MNKVAIIGSRDYPHLPQVSAFIRALPAGTVIISGAARGVDEAAARAARAFGFQVHEMAVDTLGLPPEESGFRRLEFGRRAYERNVRMVKFADEVVAFWTWCGIPGCNRGPEKHPTHGTAHTCAEATRIGRPLRLIGPDGVEATWLRAHGALPALP